MTDKEKIKAALRFCSDKPDNCIGCPVFSPDDVSDCTSNVMNVAANIIDKLEAENAALREKLAAANKRADAAIEDIKRMDRYIAKSDDPYAALCQVCKHKPQVGERCKRCDVYDNTGFEWRGPKDGEEKTRNV